MFSLFTGNHPATPPVNPLTSAPSQSNDPVRAEFTEQVKELCSHQRNAVADRVVKISALQGQMWTYFFGCEATAVALYGISLKMWGPRNLLSDKMYFVRPLGPVVAMGVAAFGILHQCRVNMMKVRLWSLIEDFDYEIKKTKSHHVHEGAVQLAWLQFVLDQIKNDRCELMNVDALRSEPKMLPAKSKFGIKL